MSKVQRNQRGPALVNSRPAGNPLATDDGRPYITEDTNDWGFFMPDPVRAGDTVFCQGVRIGTVLGDTSVQCGWWIDVLPTGELPAELARRLLAYRVDSAIK